MKEKGKGSEGKGKDTEGIGEGYRRNRGGIVKIRGVGMERGKGNVWILKKKGEGL